MTGVPRLTKPYMPIVELGLTELIGINEQVDQNDDGGSVAISFDIPTSGEILNALFVATEDGSGAVQTPAGTLLIFDANPAITAGDTALAAGTWEKLIGMITIAASDWKSDTAGAAAYVCDTPICFHDVTALYLAWLHEDATSFNDAVGDDEQLEVNLWIRRDS